MLEKPSQFDWCSFFSLFWNDKGLKCKVNIPDTVLFRNGQLSAWWATTKDGNLQRHTSQSTTVEAIRLRFLEVSAEDEANYSKFVAISRHGDGRPQLLRMQAFNQLSELLSDRLEAGHPDECPSIETPSVMQSFIQPYQDLRYVTTLVNNGTNLTCHTFQRKFSRRYAAMSATAAAAAADTGANDIILGADIDSDSRRKEADQQMGAVPPALKLKLRKLVANIVKYVQQAHNLTIGGLVCEFFKDASDKIFLLSILRVEWASNAGGHGSGSLASTIMQGDAVELNEGLFDGDQEEELDEDGPDFVQALEPLPSPQLTPSVLPRDLLPSQGSMERPSSRQTDLRPNSRELSPRQAGSQRSNTLTDYPGGNRAPAIPMSLGNAWSFAGNGSGNGNEIPKPSSSGSLPSLPPVLEVQIPNGRGKQSRPIHSPAGNKRQVPSASPMAVRRSGQDGNQGKMQIRGGAGFGFGSSRPNTAAVDMVRPGTTGSMLGGAGMRGSPALVQQLQKEVEMLRDRVMSQAEVVEASSAKVREMEREREAVIGTYGNRSVDLQLQLDSFRADNKMLENEKKSWQERAEAAEQKLHEIDAQRDEKAVTLSQERGTTLKVLREHMEREEIDQVRIEQLQSEVLRLSEQLKIETTSINALKRQLLEYSVIAEQRANTLRDGICEPGMEETVELVAHLFNDQANPTGEMYAVQKVITHYHADLRSVFLYYAQLEMNFTDHWPPSLTFAQWMLFCKDSETSDARANAHVRNNANYLLLSPTDCQTIFAKYARQDGVAAEQATLSGNGGASVDNCILSYESFLAAIIHIATRIRRPEVTFLSEASREYILRYLSKAGRVTPAGLKKGQVRTALQGTGSKSENNNSHAQHSYLGALESHASFPSQSPKASTPPSRASTPAAGSKSPKKSRNKAVSSANSAKVASAGGASDMAGQMTSNLGMGREEIAHSAIVRELEMMDVASQGRIPKEVVRRGGGFNLV